MVWIKRQQGALPSATTVEILNYTWQPRMDLVIRASKPLPATHALIGLDECGCVDNISLTNRDRTVRRRRVWRHPRVGICSMMPAGRSESTNRQHQGGDEAADDARDEPADTPRDAIVEARPNR